MINRVELMEFRNNKLIADSIETFNNKQFSIIETYRCIHPYGGYLEVRITMINDERTQATIQYIDCGTIETVQIEVDTDGTEIIEAWEYKGHKGYYLATNL